MFNQKDASIKPARVGSLWESTWTCDPKPQGRLSCSALFLQDILKNYFLTNKIQNLELYSGRQIAEIKVFECKSYRGEYWWTCTGQSLSVTCAPWNQFKVDCWNQGDFLKSINHKKCCTCRECVCWCLDQCTPWPDQSPRWTSPCPSSCWSYNPSSNSWCFKASHHE